MAAYPPKLELNRERTLDLLTGDRFYSSADAALREAVLNAIDACGRRATTEAGYQPSIEVIFDDEQQRVTISDNGIGMNQDDLVDFFSTIGSTIDQLGAEEGTEDYRAVGEFGIGVISYFQVADTFHVQTRKAGEEACGLEFGADMMDSYHPAKTIEPTRDEPGTDIVLFVRDPGLFQLLLDRYSYWFRDVEPLSGQRQPEGETLEQGGHRQDVDPITIEEPPEWLEDAYIGPPIDTYAWSNLEGYADVDVLYRGVFVQQIQIKNLWGIQGSLDVDPKSFAPRLNRESFIPEGFEQSITDFLQRIHPRVLRKALDTMRAAVKGGGSDDWDLYKWLTLWLAVPRSGEYADVAESWDEEFRNLEAFTSLEQAQEQDVTLAYLETLGTPIYVAPPNLRDASDLVRHAVRLLRAKGYSVIQGKSRDSGFLTQASLIANTTTDLMLHHFGDSLGELITVHDVAESILQEQEETLLEIYEKDPIVRMINMGEDAAPIVSVRQEIWINIDTSIGHCIVDDICTRNEGHLGLLVACQKYATQYMNQIINQFRRIDQEPQVLGPVKRQYLRSLIS